MKTAFLFAIVFLMLFSENAFAQSAYRCNDKLVYVGDDAGEVVGKCGEPAYRHTSEQRTQGSFSSGTVRTGRGSSTRQGFYDSTTIARETWTYNCGDGTTIHFLIFEGGKLKEIKTGGFGTGPRRCN